MDVASTVEVAEKSPTTNEDYWANRRTCRCCGSSIMASERKAVDVFHPGLDVCPDCLPHMFEKSCLDG